MAIRVLFTSDAKPPSNPVLVSDFQYQLDLSLSEGFTMWYSNDSLIILHKPDKLAFDYQKRVEELFGVHPYSQAAHYEQPTQAIGKRLEDKE